MNGRLLMARHQPRVREKAVALPHPASMSCIAHVTSQPAVVGAVHRCHGARARARGDIAACARPPLKQLAKKGEFRAGLRAYIYSPSVVTFLPAFSLCPQIGVDGQSRRAANAALLSLTHTQLHKPRSRRRDTTGGALLLSCRAALHKPQGCARESSQCNMLHGSQTRGDAARAPNGGRQRRAIPPVRCTQCGALPNRRTFLGRHASCTWT
jgi:hypothetical protein